MESGYLSVLRQNIFFFFSLLLRSLRHQHRQQPCADNLVDKPHKHKPLSMLARIFLPCAAQETCRISRLAISDLAPLEMVESRVEMASTWGTVHCSKYSTSSLTGSHLFVGRLRRAVSKNTEHHKHKEYLPWEKLKGLNRCTWD